jgi:hemolysin activation/secretion protein
MWFKLLLLLCASGAARFLTAAEPVAQTFQLKKLIIADTEAKAAALPATSGGDAKVFVQDVSVLSEPGFAASVESFLGKPITNDLLNGLANAIAQFARQNDRLIVKVLPPNQDISAGIFRLAVVVGRYNELQFKGNRWFSSKLLQEKLGIKVGDEVRLSTLEEAVKWANANPFRQIKVLVNDLANQPGKADLIVGVEERIPLRFTASYDDTGTEILGNRHYTGSLHFGNLWGRDHQGTYQYTTTDHPDVFQSHSIDYRVPLPWRHNLQFSGGYLTVKPTFGADGAFTQNGKNILAGLRYSAPVRGGDTPIEFTAGLDFKQGNNNLAYGGTTIIRNTTDTFQVSMGISMIQRDQRGAWLFGVNVDASPGNINSRNTDEAFSNARLNTKATYLTGTVSVQRLLTLEKDWSLFSRAVAKVATANIPGSEQLSIGGSSTVRGFNERIYSGDQGFVFSNDLQGPALRKALPFLGKNRAPLETRFIAFYDAAQVFYKVRDRSDAILTPLASTGIGVRLTLPVNFTLSADYGWQITHLSYAAPTHSRGHVKVVLAF